MKVEIVAIIGDLTTTENVNLKILIVECSTASIKMRN